MRLVIFPALSLFRFGYIACKYIWLEKQSGSLLSRATRCQLCTRAPREKRLTSSRNHALEFAEESLLLVLQREALIYFLGASWEETVISAIAHHKAEQGGGFICREVHLARNSSFAYQLRLMFCKAILILGDISVLRSLWQTKWKDVNLVNLEFISKEKE